jgi:antirestriction protein
MDTATTGACPQTVAPRVWVGCLGCYNAGRLVGEWCDASDCPQEMGELVARVGRLPADHHAEAHEELWCFDHDDFAGLLSGECSPSDARRLAGTIDGITRDGYDIAAVVAWRDHVSADLSEWDGPTRDAFADAYDGEHDTPEDWAWSFLDDAGMLAELPGWVDQSAVVAAWCRDAFLDGMTDVPTGRGTVYVFQSV